MNITSPENATMAGKIDQAITNMIKNLEEKTGKSIAEWVAIVKKSGAAKHGEVVKHLKEKHGLTHGYANMVAHTAAGNQGDDKPADDDLVAAQYAGDKAPLRTCYDALIKKISAFGSDLEISPKKTYVSLRRAKQFALIQPTTKTRLDVGINLKGIAPKGRLEASGSFNSMVSHRVRVESPKDIDDQLIAWLRQAYESAS
jgi:predicted transport protein